MFVDDRPFSRRAFLASSAAGAAVAVPTIVSARALGLEPGTASANERIVLGVIGYGPRCRYVLGSMLGLPDVQCVAIADVQKSRRDEGKKLVDHHYGHTGCMVYRDLRDMLARDDIDAVLVATGDRWHAPASILAAEAGKDVYCEKPCGLTIANVEDLAAAMKRKARIFQVGTQRRSVPQFQSAVEMAREGQLGKLQSLHASVYRPEIANQWLPAEPTPPREECDWNLWLGPAPWRPYNSSYVAGKWRSQFDFESGARLLDWGTHTVDMCQWANGADGTVPVEYEPGPLGITCRYANGVTLMLDFLEEPFGDRGPNWNTKLGICPVRFEGSEAAVEVGDDGIQVTRGGVASPTEQIKKARGLDAQAHARNFFDCVRSRKATTTHEDVMLSSHTACFAASLSWILGRKLLFDPKKREFVGDPEANSLRVRPERQWS